MTYRELWGMLTPLYGEAEAHAVADYVLDVGFGLSKADVMCGAIESMAAADAARLDMMAARLSQGEPVQYVVGRAYFCGRWFGVRPGVLVPRPETEELCALVEADFRGRGPLSVLDVGTGSGCIAVTLRHRMPSWQVDAFDISADALAVAARNARRHGVEVRFRLCDILQSYPGDEQWDVVVSNPPYIPEREKAHMARQVLAHEPARALFVPDGHPLLFYEHIGAFAWRHLSAGGRLYFEIHYDAGAAVVELLRSLGFAEVELRRDLAGHDRMVKAVR